MVSDPAYIREFKKFAQGQPSAEDLSKLEDELYGTSDRASAVMLASFTEAALERFLRSKIRPNYSANDIRRLFEFSGILGSFGEKIIASYAFNWVGAETKHELDIIRLLRNEFAHSRKSFGFSDPPVAAVCGQLRSPDWPGAFIPLGSFERATTKEDAEKTSPRTRFRSAYHTILYGLLSHAEDTMASATGHYTNLR